MKRIKENNYIVLRDVIEMFESDLNIVRLAYQDEFEDFDEDYTFKFDTEYLISILENEVEYKKGMMLDRLTRLLNSTSRLIKEIKRN